LRWRLKLYKEEQCHYLTEICVRFSAVATSACNILCIANMRKNYVNK